jgi:hypothetical protein
MSKLFVCHEGIVGVSGSMYKTFAQFTDNDIDHLFVGLFVSHTVIITLQFWVVFGAV